MRESEDARERRPTALFMLSAAFVQPKGGRGRVTDEFCRPGAAACVVVRLCGNRNEMNANIFLVSYTSRGGGLPRRPPPIADCLVGPCRQAACWAPNGVALLVAQHQLFAAGWAQLGRQPERHPGRLPPALVWCGPGM